MGEPTDPTTPTDPTDPTTDPTEPPSDDPADPADPADPVVVGTMTAEEAAAHCADDELLVDDPASDTDDYDLCVVANTAPEDGETAPETPVVPPIRDESTPPRD